MTEGAQIIDFPSKQLHYFKANEMGCSNKLEKGIQCITSWQQRTN